MLHGAPIQQRHKAANFVQTTRHATLRSFNDRRLQVPQNTRGLVLAHRQQALARRDQTPGHLVKISEYSAAFVKSKRSADQAKRRTVMNQASRAKRGLPRRTKNRKIT